MAFAHKRAITIDHTKAGASDSSNFPFLFSGTYANLKVTGSGGEVTNSNGYDIGFYSDSGLTTKLDWEVEKYVSTTGEIVAWVRIPTLSHTSDTVIYIADGDSGITTFQGNVNGVWETAAKGVWHMNNGTGNNVLDSTSNTNTGTPVASPADATGQIGQALSFNGSSQYVDAGTPSSLNNLPHNGDFTVAGWVKTGVTADTGERMIDKREPPVGGAGWYIGMINVSSLSISKSVDFYIDTGATGARALTVNNLIPSNTWTFIVGIYNHSANTATVYVNGSLATNNGTYSTTGSVTPPVDSSYNTLIGSDSAGDSNAWWNGSLDDVRIYNRALSADEITANYNSTNSPSTFYGVGSDQGGGGVATGFMTTMNGIWGI
jgi:uncharacterized membrane protein